MNDENERKLAKALENLIQSHDEFLEELIFSNHTPETPSKFLAREVAAYEQRAEGDWMLVKNVVVTGCTSCPMLQKDQTLWCGHPFHKTEEEAHIVHRDFVHQIPTKCPLLPS